MIDATVWTCVEPAVGILAACLSNMRPLLRFITRGPPDHSNSDSTFNIHPFANLSNNPFALLIDPAGSLK